MIYKYACALGLVRAIFLLQRYITDFIKGKTASYAICCKSNQREYAANDNCHLNDIFSSFMKSIILCHVLCKMLP